MSLHKLFDAFSLTGAIIVILTSLTFIGVFRGDKDVWREAFTALTTFISGRGISKLEEINKKKKRVSKRR
jgi:hypothetical protein